jgi:Domain of unknown function (DUF5679)
MASILYDLILLEF